MSETTGSCYWDYSSQDVRYKIWDLEINKFRDTETNEILDDDPYNWSRLCDPNTYFKCRENDNAGTWQNNRNRNIVLVWDNNFRKYKYILVESKQGSIYNYKRFWIKNSETRKYELYFNKIDNHNFRGEQVDENKVRVRYVAISTKKNLLWDSWNRGQLQFHY